MENVQESLPDHQLWLNLSALGDGNVFAILPQLIRDILNSGMDLIDEDDEIDIVLPSDDAWKEKIYYRLVERQRNADAEDNKMLDSLTHQPEEKLHEWNIVPRAKATVCESIPRTVGTKKIIYGPGPITWTVGDLAKAGCLLHVPQISTYFDDEQEMRRLREIVPVVWLLFYDLYHRSFKKRETAVAPIAMKLFPSAGLMFAENALWCQRVKLAAAVARLRIKYNALSLKELLPLHLRGNKIDENGNSNPLTVWVNNKKFKNSHDICKQIEHSLKLKLTDDDAKELKPGSFKWDRHCPLTIAFHYSMRTQLAKSNLVRNHKLVVQDRSFCVGPATFWKVVEDLQLSGCVIQTHVNSPRSTAYLATLLSQNEKIKKIMAFSAGKRKSEYDEYLHDLGMTNVVIFSDRLVDVGPEFPNLEEVVAVYATPPNSYTAVNDPVDLVCSRGGDLSMLEILTESEESMEGRNRVVKILEEQRKTLKFAMSKPQIQVVLYETHSELDVENVDMVQKTLKEINRLAKMHHASLQGLLTSINFRSGTHTMLDVDPDKEINNNKNAALSEQQRQDSLRVCAKICGEETDDEEKGDVMDEKFKEVLVPDTDLFDSPDLPCLCPNENCFSLSKDGCYLALLQRKKVIRLDNKYMIQMAEQRGLFGSSSSTSLKAKGNRGARKKRELMEHKPKKMKRKLKETEELELAKSVAYNVNYCQVEHFAESPTDKLTEALLWPECSICDSETETVLLGQNSEHTSSNDVPPKKIAEFLGKLTKNQIKNLVSSSFKVGLGPIFAPANTPKSNRTTSAQDEKTKSTSEPAVPQKKIKLNQKRQPLHGKRLVKPRISIPSAGTRVLKSSLPFKMESIEKSKEVKATPIYNIEFPIKMVKPKYLLPNTDLSRKLNEKFFHTFITRTQMKQAPKILFADIERAKMRKMILARVHKTSIEKAVQMIQTKRKLATSCPVSPSFNVKTCCSKHSRKHRKRSKRITEEIIKRIAIPTQASRMRMLSEHELPRQRRTFGGTVTRDFVCELCRRRHCISCESK